MSKQGTTNTLFNLDDFFSNILGQGSCPNNNFLEITDGTNVGYGCCVKQGLDCSLGLTDYAYPGGEINVEDSACNILQLQNGQVTGQGKGIMKGGVCISDEGGGTEPAVDEIVCEFDTNNISCEEVPDYAYPVFNDSPKVCVVGTKVFCNGGKLFKCAGNNSWFPDVNTPSKGTCKRYIPPSQ